ncbi:hypothetical protein PIB30_072018 [Stylosanthes scabra]|uniref:Uncharacterized protein n=1 Tax=Stylosanthes scabra TaxID=79078 RepID=A0ABU6WM81_9FABA|nr:hypothetical protein [Stylosanthes scabra]
MVVEDSKGQRIHLQLPKRLSKKWRVHLKEFQMYKITNVIVLDPRMRNKLKTIPCPCVYIVGEGEIIQLMIGNTYFKSSRVGLARFL